MEVEVCVTVDPSAGVETCVTVDGGTEDVEGVEVGVENDEDEDEDDELDEVVVDEELDDCEELVEEEDELVGGRLVGDVMDEEVSEDETGVELLLATDFDDTGVELAGAEGAVVECGAGEDGVLVELEPDIVNCLTKTSFLGCL